MLRHTMDRLVKDCERIVAALQAKGESDVHLSACHQVADTYELWEDAPAIPEAGFPEPGQRFPLWLSRVVEGVIQDCSTGVPQYLENEGLKILKASVDRDLANPYAPGDLDT